MTILFSIPLFLVLIAIGVAVAKSNGSWARGLKIFFLALLGLLVLSAGICALIVFNLDFKNMH